MTTDPADPLSLALFVRANRCGVVATVSELEAPEAALVGLAALDDGTLIFDSPVDSRKITNLRTRDRVAVVVGTVGDVTVQIEGTAFVAERDERERLGRAYLDEFPGGRALHEDFAVVGIRPNWVRVYDASDERPVIVESQWEG